jgi:tRNA(fMet)-specific endonuclease VapC
MDYIILDTDVCSFLFKGDSRKKDYRPHLIGRTPCLSFQTVAELYQWAEINSWGQNRRAQLDKWLPNFVILPYDNETAQAWARIRAERRRQGRPISTADAWIAACALRYDCPLITHNAGDYGNISQLIVITADNPND